MRELQPSSRGVTSYTASRATVSRLRRLSQGMARGAGICRALHRGQRAAHCSTARLVFLHKLLRGAAAR